MWADGTFNLNICLFTLVPLYSNQLFSVYIILRPVVNPIIILQMKHSLVQELQQKAEKTELLQVELQMLETERVRLSLVEEKLVDIMQLLQQLRDLVSRRHSNSTCVYPVQVMNSRNDSC